MAGTVQSFRFRHAPPGALLAAAEVAREHAPRRTGDVLGPRAPGTKPIGSVQPYGPQHAFLNSKIGFGLLGGLLNAGLSSYELVVKYRFWGCYEVYEVHLR